MRISIPRGMRTFLVVLVGQVISMLGSGLGGFALGVWVFEETGSPAQFALISFFGTLPGLLVSPVAGTLVDRWDRRWTMILSDLGAGLCTLLVAFLAWHGRLEVWHVYLMVTGIMTFTSFQNPALSASTVLLVPKRHLERASGLAQVGGAATEIVAPILAGFLLLQVGLHGVMAIDFATFLVGVGALLLVRIPRPRRSDEGEAGRGSLRTETRAGWRFVRERPGLFGLLLMSAAVNLSLGMVIVLLTPMVLSFANAAVLGTILSTASFGFLIGALVVSAFGVPGQRVRAIFGITLLQGLLLMAGGARQSVPLIAGAAFFFMVLNPIVNACDRVIWQTKVPTDLQGRVFAIRRMVGGISLPVAFLLGGWLAEEVFEPLLQPGGALAGSVGQVIGVGPGRGMGFELILLGTLLIVTTFAAAAFPRLRRVESELADRVDDDEPELLEATSAHDEPLGELENA